MKCDWVIKLLIRKKIMATLAVGNYHNSLHNVLRCCSVHCHNHQHFTWNIVIKITTIISMAIKVYFETIYVLVLFTYSPPPPPPLSLSVYSGTCRPIQKIKCQPHDHQRPVWEVSVPAQWRPVWILTSARLCGRKRWDLWSWLSEGGKKWQQYEVSIKILLSMWSWTALSYALHTVFSQVWEVIRKTCWWKYHIPLFEISTSAITISTNSIIHYNRQFPYALQKQWKS